MSKQLHPVFATLLFLFGIQCTMAQDVQALLAHMEQQSQQYPQEKIYLQLDKYAYSAGESIWFKTYTTVGIGNLFSNISGIAYVDLIDASKKVVHTMTIPLVMGLGMGDIKLNDTITEGSYRLRAYTSWMRNFDDTYFYDRTLQIANGRSDNVLTTTRLESVDKDNNYRITLQSLAGVALQKTDVRYEVIQQGKSVERKRATTDASGQLLLPINKKYADAYIRLQFENLEKRMVTKLLKAPSPTLLNSVQLFPEGGKLLQNKMNTIAAKIINPQGLGIPGKVYFIAGKDTVTVIETNALGMGAGYLFFDAANPLTAIAKFEDGTSMDVPMPPVYSSGYSMAVNSQSGTKLFAQVSVSDDLLSDKDLYFVVHHLGTVIHVSKQKMNKAEMMFTVPKDALPTGVLTLSVVDDRMLPVMERAVFNFHEASLVPATVNLNKATYGTREKVSVDIKVGNATDSLRMGAFSASVLDLSKIQDASADEPNILSTLLLSNDISGYIETPGFYFQQGMVNIKDLDLLMLTQGWRKLDWTTLDKPHPPKYAVEKNLKISGYTKKLGRTKAEPHARMQLVSTKNFMDFMDTTSNAEGYFEFDLLYPDSVKFLVTAKDSVKGKNNIDILINPLERAAVGDNRNRGDERWDINSLYIDEIHNAARYFSELENKGLMDKVISIDEVVVRATQKKKIAENSRNLNGPGNADQVLTAEELSSCPTLDICLNGRLVGVMFRNGVPYSMRGGGPMQVVLDGMYVEADQLSMINVQDIESVEVLRNVNYTTVYGSYGANGVIIITSKTGQASMHSYVPKGIITVEQQGIYVNKVFYKPMYDVADAVKLAQDLRTTIHWEPSIVADKDGHATFDFFTSDGTGKYSLILEGLDLNGRILRKEVIIDVQP
ncbi:TonB-dependent receptor plug domain-containing protein [Sphingobacterium sp. Mn56C]|uniref:TonB-dependent receptor plug domain-containing protein n=1 Tax=Sphingobacterium sp. Mn56C TaxID=3395261 RepID=UPI003BBD743C